MRRVVMRSPAQSETGLLLTASPMTGTTRARRLSRREFGRAAGSAFASCVAGAACAAVDRTAPSRQGTLTVRPLPASTTWLAGTHDLGLGRGRDGVLHVPATTGERSLPLIVLLHGAGGSGRSFLQDVRAVAEAFGAAVLAPDSRDRTWDALLSQQDTLLDVLLSERHLAGFGPDVEFLDSALDRVFRTVAVDPTRLVIGGFSDGATYALSLGLVNGGLFRRVVAFSPGFVLDGPRIDQPEIFVSHGRADEVLPIEYCSRRIVPALRTQGYRVTFREFDGGHRIPDAVAREALAWATRPGD